MVGYLAALLVAVTVVAIYIKLTSGPEREASGGMFAFGDTLAFLAVFAVASVPATAAALYFLRSRAGVWMPLAMIALMFVAITLVALVVHLGSVHTDPQSPAPAWTPLATLWVLGAPLFGLGFVLAGLFAPIRRARTLLLVAAAAEILAFGVIPLAWLLSSRS